MDLVGNLTHRLLRLHIRPSRASAFCGEAVPNCAYNGTFPVSFNLPNILVQALNVSVNCDELALAKKAVIDGCVFAPFAQKIPETPPMNRRGQATKSTIDTITGPPISAFFVTRGQLFVNSDISLQNIASNGPATEQSKPDILVCSKDTSDNVFGLAVIELKDSEASPVTQIGQAYSEGCNVILDHLARGLDRSSAAVPLVLTNGTLYQFGWVTLLEPSLPVLHMTSSIMDMSCNVDVIAKHLCQVKMFCRQQSKKIQSLSQSRIPVHIQIDQDKYYLKKFKDVFNRDNCDVIHTLGYQWKIFEALKDIPQVVHPVGMAKLKFDDDDQDVLISPFQRDFKMGVPSDARLVQLFLTALKHALDRIHAAGVVHVDLYPSNVLWKLQGDEMLIRIIDWDAATFLGEDFTHTMSARLVKVDVAQYYYASSKTAQKACDYWFLYIMSRLNDDERRQMNGDVSSVNEAYMNAVDRLVIDAGGREKLVATFKVEFPN